MASMLPAAQAPILAMSGGGMSGASMLPAAPPVHIAGMHGGGSMLPHAPDVPMIAMRGGGVTAESFGITFFNDEKEPDTSSCALITKTPTLLCKSLQPFVDRRVQALLNRVNTRGKNKVDIGCGEITREDKRLTISFHKNAITLLSGNLTGTFAKFHEDMTRRHQPNPVSMSGGVGTDGLLSWMLGSRVIEGGRFDLITFMERMKKENPVLPLKGFHRFLSYHKEKVEEMDVLRYAMELYGYRTGAVDKDVYGLILSTDTAVRRVGDKFAVYNNGAVTSGSWDGSWNSDAGGFAVFEPTLVVAKTSASSGAASASASGAAAPATAKAAAASSPSTSATAKAAASGASDDTASAPSAMSAPLQPGDYLSNVQFDEWLKSIHVNPKKSTVSNTSSKKINDVVDVPDRQRIDGKDYSLRGAIYHEGGTTRSGHYMYLYHPLPDSTSSNNWVVFSDTSVTPGPRPTTLINNGYVYLFERDGQAGGTHKGITNHGQSCWMNAAIQMFYHIPEYRAYVEDFIDNKTLPPDTIRDTLLLKEIFLKYSNASSASIECENEYKALFKATFGEGEGTQQDTMEFIMSVLLKIIAPIDGDEVKSGYHNNDKRAALRNLFTIYRSSTVTCPSAGYTRKGQEEEVLTLSLVIPSPSSSSSLTLDNLIAFDTKPNKTDFFKVNGTPCLDTTTTRNMSIPKTTKYVIIDLVRFSFSDRVPIDP